MIKAKVILIVLPVLILTLISEVIYAYEWNTVTFPEYDSVFEKVVPVTTRKYLLSSDEGLFFYEDDTLKKIFDEPVLAIEKTGHTVFFSSSDSIYYFRDGIIKDLSDIYALRMVRSGNEIVFYNNDGIYVISEMKILSVEDFRGAIITGLYSCGSKVVIQTLNSIFLYESGKVKELESGDRFNISDAGFFGDRIFLFSDSGNRLIDAEGNINKVDVDFSPDHIYGYDGNSYILKDRELYYYSEDRFVPYFGRERAFRDNIDFYSFSYIRNPTEIYFIFLSGDGNLYVYSEYLNNEEDYLNTQYTLAEKLFYADNNARAEQILEDLYEKYNRDFEVMALLGRVKRRRREYDNAIRFLGEAFSLRETSDILVELAGIHTERNDLKLAYLYLMNARRLSPHAMNIYVNIVENLQARQLYDQALHMISSTEEKFGPTFAMHRERLKIYRLQHEYDLLDELYPDMMREYPDRSYFVRKYIEYLTDRYDWPEALEVISDKRERFEEELAEFFDVTEARILVEEKEYIKAEKMLYDLIQDYPESYGPSVMMAYLYMKTGRYELGEKFLSSAKRAGMPDDWLAEYIYGYIALKENRFIQAMERLERSVMLNPLFPYARYHLADMYLRGRQVFRASRQYRLIIQYWPDFEHIEKVYDLYKSIGM
ncbi:MAG: tetratricopeptide repeat protein [Candidatus Muiribacteriaceae bacterium]